MDDLKNWKDGAMDGIPSDNAFTCTCSIKEEPADMPDQRDRELDTRMEPKLACENIPPVHSEVTCGRLAEGNLAEEDLEEKSLVKEESKETYSSVPEAKVEVLPENAAVTGSYTCDSETPSTRNPGDDQIDIASCHQELIIDKAERHFGDGFINDAKEMQCMTSPTDSVKSSGETSNTLIPSSLLYEPLETKDDAARHTSSDNRKVQHQCTVCNKTFTQKYNLARHMRTHTGERPYKCSVCNKTFTQKSTLADHMRTHTGECPFKCFLCVKSFTEKGHLATHIRTHTRERPFKCSVCNKTFKEKWHLACHVRTHTGERPFKCSVCDQAFKEKGHLACHVRTHTGERPFKCCVCKKTFTWRNTLARHMGTHIGEHPYNCSFCNKNFSHRSILADHMRTHTGEHRLHYPATTHVEVQVDKSHSKEQEAHRCDLCQERFRYQTDLRNHVKTHSYVPSILLVNMAVSRCNEV